MRQRLGRGWARAALALLVALAALAALATPAYAALGTSPSRRLTWSLVLWEDPQPVTMVAGVGVLRSSAESLAALPPGSAVVQCDDQILEPLPGATIVFFVDDCDVGTAITDCDGEATFLYDPSDLLPGPHTMGWRFEGGSVGGVDYDGCSDSAELDVQGTYGFIGFLPPLRMGVPNTARAGQTIPAKWQLTDPHDAFVTSLNAVVKIESVGPLCGEDGGEPIPVDTSGASDLRYDAEADQYIVSFQTEKGWAGTCRRFVLTLSDGTTHTADFQFK